MRFGIAALVGLALSGPAHAELTAKEALAKIDAKSDHGLLTLWINGHVNALMWANVELGAKGRTQLFCQPGKLSLTPDQDVEILRQHVREVPKAGEPHRYGCHGSIRGDLSL